MVSQIPLNKLREVILRQVKKIHDNTVYGNEEIFQIVDANIDIENNLSDLRVHVLIVQNTLSFQNYAVNIIIERYRVTVNSIEGNVTIFLPLLNINEPDTFVPNISIEFATKELWDNSSPEDIKQHIINEWNK